MNGTLLFMNNNVEIKCFLWPPIGDLLYENKTFF